MDNHHQIKSNRNELNTFADFTFNEEIENPTFHNLNDSLKPKIETQSRKNSSRMTQIYGKHV